MGGGMLRLAVVMLVPGCTMEAVLWPPDTGKGAEVVELREYECPPADCSKQLVYDMAALEACYGYDDYYGWAGNTPYEIVERCVPGQGECEIPVYNDTVDTRNAELCESCLEGSSGEATPPDCCYNGTALEGILTEDWAAEGAELQGQIDSDCQIQAEVELDCDYGDLQGGLGEPCPPEAMRVAGADYVLEVDPEASFVTLRTAEGPVTTKLAGTAAVASHPAQVLVAIVDAQDVVAVSGQPIDDLRFWFSNDILLDTQRGTFTVPEQGASMSARGQLNGGWFAVAFEPTAAASGAFAAGRWDLDYVSTFSGGGVELHLEGPLHATSL